MDHFERDTKLWVLPSRQRNIERNKKESDFGLVKSFFALGCVFSLITTFVPNQKQLAFIMAAPHIIENKDLQEAGKNSAEIIRLGTEYLKQSLEMKGVDND